MLIDALLKDIRQEYNRKYNGEKHDSTPVTTKYIEEKYPWIWNVLLQQHNRFIRRLVCVAINLSTHQ